MKKIILPFMTILLGVILQGCTNIPKQKFIEEANDLSNKDKVPIYFTQSEQSDINMKYEQYYRKLLRNNKIMGAAYDEAVIENKAQSIESILNTNWHYKLLKRGIIHLDDNEKMTVITILTNKLLSATYLECAAINSELGNIFHLLDIDETNKIIQIQYKAVLAGTVKPNLNIIDANKDAYVALIAMAAKAKETISDKELGDILYDIINNRKKRNGHDCKTMGTVFGLVNLVEPKYRSALFNIPAIH